MANYDYTTGKKRIDEILNNKLEVIEQNSIPNDNDFTFTNAYYGWVTGMFIDIRQSTTLFASQDKAIVSKIIRSFTSEIIEILRMDNNLREIGIRGDCVYSIYTTPTKDDIYEIVDKGIWTNTFMRMLNKQLKKKNYSNIIVGIGISTAKELVIKAGRKDVGINNKVWIGKAVSMAANYSSLGNTGNYNPIIVSECTYDNFIEKFKKNNGVESQNWFRKFSSKEYGTHYDVSLIKTDFNEWIDNNV